VIEIYSIKNQIRYEIYSFVYVRFIEKSWKESNFVNQNEVFLSHTSRISPR